MPPSTSIGMYPAPTPIEEFARKLAQRSEVQTSILRDSLLASITSPNAARIVEEVNAEVDDPGFFERWVLGPLTYAQRAITSGVTGGQISEPGELLRESPEGVPGYSTLGQGDLGAALNQPVQSMPKSKFAGPESTGIIRRAVVRALGAQEKAKEGDSYFSYEAAARGAGNVAQFTGELALNIVADPLFLLTSVKPVFATVEAGSRLLPTFRSLSAIEVGRAKRAGEHLGVQVAGPGVFMDLGRRVFDLAGRGTSIASSKLLDLSPLPKEMKARLSNSVSDTLQIAGEKMTQFRRAFDKYGFFREHGEGQQLLIKDMTNHRFAGEYQVPRIVDKSMEGIFQRVPSIQTDALSTRRGSLMSVLVDEGIILDPFIPEGEQLIKTLRPLEKRVGNILDIDLATRFAKAFNVDPSELPQIAEDAYRLRYGFRELFNIEHVRGLNERAHADYITHIVKNPADFERMARINSFLKAVSGDPGSAGMQAIRAFNPYAMERDVTSTLWQSVKIAAQKMWKNLDRPGAVTDEFIRENIDSLLKKTAYELDARKIWQVRQSSTLRNIIRQDYYTDLSTVLGGSFAENASMLTQLMRADFFGGQKLIERAGVPVKLNASTAVWSGATDNFRPAADVFKTKDLQFVLEQTARNLGIEKADLMIPASLAKEVTNHLSRSSTLARQFDSWMRTSWTGQLFEGMTDLWKRAVTRINPAFYVINVLGDSERGVMSLGAAALNPYTMASVNRVLRGTEDVVNLGRYGNHTAANVLELGRRHGVLGSYEARIETRTLGGVEGNILQGIKGARESVTRALGVPQLTSAITPRGVGIGEYIEEAGRMTLFMNGLKKGMTPQESANMVFETLFNYFHGLTDFERQVMRRMIPFYSFLRFNAGFQSTSLINVPARSLYIERTARAATSTAGADVTFRDLLMPYEQELVQFGTTDSEGRPSSVGIRFTTREFFQKLPSSFRTEALKESANSWFQNFHPVIAGSVRWLMDRDPFYGGPAKEVMVSKNFRVFEHAPDLVKDFLGWRPHVTTLGERTYQIDPGKYFLLSLTGMGRMLSTAGRLEQAGIPTPFNWGMGIRDTQEHFTFNELTKAQGIVSALLGAPYQPFGPLQTVRRESIQDTRRLGMLQKRLGPERAAGELLLPPQGLR